MTTEKLQELTQARLAHFGEHFTDEAMAVYLNGQSGHCAG